MSKLKKNVQPPAQFSASVDAVSDATLNGFIGYHLKRASNVAMADLAQVLKPFGLRMITYTALVLIVDNPGLRQSQLAAAMDVERPNLVMIIDELEALDLVVRHKVPTDRRAYALSATDAGHALYEQAIKAVSVHEQTMLEGFTSTMQKMFVEAATKIRKNLRDLDA